MKYRHLNEISKYFKPVDYIEDTGLDIEQKLLQNGYASNMRTMKKFADDFNIERDSIVFTFHRSLRQNSTDKFRLIVNNANNNFNILHCDINNITSDNIYSLILSAVLQFMYRMSTKTDCDINVPDIGTYMGISAAIEIQSGSNSEDKPQHRFEIIYIPDVMKYKDLICAQNIIKDVPNNLESFFYNEYCGNGRISEYRIDISLVFALDALYMSEHTAKIYADSVVAAKELGHDHEFVSKYHGITPVKAMVQLMQTMDQLDIWKDDFLPMTSVSEICKSVENRDARQLLIDLLYSKGTTTILCDIANLKHIFNIDFRNFANDECRTRNDVMNIMLTCIDIMSAEKKKYLSDRSSAIKSQLKMFTGALQNAILIDPSALDMKCTYLVPDASEPPAANGYESFIYGYSPTLII